MCRKNNVYEPIGDGISGFVYSGKRNGKEVAIKRMFLDDGFMVLEDVKREFRIAEILSTLYPAQFVNLVEKKVLWDKVEAHIVFELLRCDLYHAIRDRSLWMALNLSSIARQMIDAIEKMHRHGFVHCDVKSKNMLLDFPLVRLKMCDFGMVHEASSLVETPVDREITTINCRAPELCFLGKSLGSSSKKVDVWSLGCVLAELFL